MARVTVEDCVLKVPNRFDLVMLAAQRARDISSGAQLTLERDNDKNPVVALREIADETVALDVLADSLVKGFQRQVELDEPEEEDLPDLELTQMTEEMGGEATGEVGAGADTDSDAEDEDLAAAAEKLLAGALEDEERP